MIMTLTGRVLKTINSRLNVEGYQAFWDGKDESGQWVGTGVYLIAAYDLKGAASFSKIAVIRH
jgi:flagellar hook assembly protein FlgD